MSMYIHTHICNTYSHIRKMYKREVTSRTRIPIAVFSRFLIVFSSDVKKVRTLALYKVGNMTLSVITIYTYFY